MNFTSLIKRSTPHIIAALFMLLVVFVYFSPVLSGKTLVMHDITMSKAAAKEVEDFYQKTGEYSWWTNSMFGGMPTFMISGGYPNSLISKIGNFLNMVLPMPANIFFLLMMGFYFLAITIKNNPWVAVIGAVAFAFGTYNLLYTEAGHVSKIIALAYLPPLLAGFIYTFRGKLLLGSFLIALFLGLELYANHLQITYYFVFVLLAYSLYQSTKILKSGGVVQVLKIGVAIFIGSLIGTSMHAERLWNNITYSKETTRGVSELTKTEAGLNGLDKDYALAQWNYGITETVNLLIPNLMGGGSSGSLDSNSETYKILTQGGVDANQATQFVSQLPLYFGDQSFTSGPAYSGIIIIFLFILGLFINKDKIKWSLLGLVIFFIIVSWGANFSSINDLLFEYLPGFNKFRAVSITLTIVHLLLVWGAVNTLLELIESSLSLEILKKPIMYAAGVILFLIGFGYFSVSFTTERDNSFKESLSGPLGAEFSNKVVYALQQDRASLAESDILRGLFLIVLTIALIYLFKKAKINSKVFYAVLILFIVYDYFGVGKRYFNNNDFVSKNQAQATFYPSATNEQLLRDTDPDFRVINLTTNFWSDATDSYYHKSIGGYHGAKLKKIQELYDYQMIKEGNLNMPILNMLNTKYFITQGPDQKPIAQQNPEAFGNAWLIDSLISVKNADAEMDMLGKINLKNSAVTQESFSKVSKVYKKGETDKIMLKSYEPNRLVYESNVSSPQFAVFSEVYYRGNKDWISSIDGKEVDHAKVNYVLRGMEIPAGKHEIVFEFKPESVEKGKMIDLTASISFLVLGLLVIGNYIRDNKKTV